MKVHGPLVTLSAVAVLGVGLWLANVFNESEPTGANKPAVQSPTTTSATPADQAPSTPSPPTATVFPDKADYVGKIPTSDGVITVEIAVHDEKAKAYACDGKTVETWLAGSAENGGLDLVNKAKTNRLEGRLEGSTVVGTLWIGEKKYDFRAPQVQPPAGLYVYAQGGVRTSWIIDENGGVTGVQRQPGGSTSPAPPLSTDGTAVIGGQTVTANRVEGDSDVP